MNQSPKFQGFPLTRKPKRIEIIKDALLLISLVAALSFIIYFGHSTGL